jgi:hypothetical protein
MNQTRDSHKHYQKIGKTPRIHPCCHPCASRKEDSAPLSYQISTAWTVFMLDFLRVMDLDDLFVKLDVCGRIVDENTRNMDRGY